MLKAADLAIFDLYYDMAGIAMRTVGRTSDSNRLGMERGFDSGEMMDRIYNNQPSGRYGIGWLVDRFYLSQIGCKGLRGRKAYLKHALHETIQSQIERGMHPVVLDVAAGPATYLVETLAERHASDLVI